MGKSKSFSDRLAIRAHLAQGRHGMKGEIADLRVDVDEAMAAFERLFGAIFFGYSHTTAPTIFDGVNVFSYATKVGSVYQLTRDVFLADQSYVASTATVFTAGYRVSCAGKLTNDGLIHNDGKNAVGGTPGGPSALGALGIGTTGGTGRTNNVGLTGAPQTNSLGDAAAHGGAGGAGGANAGGAGGTYVSQAANGGAHHLLALLMGYLLGQTSGGNQAQTLIIGGGAGGGAGGSDNGGVTPGGGGGGGGVIVLNVLELVNNGIIRAAGGRGGDATGAGGNGGTGGGGGGGLILNMSRYRSGRGSMIVPGGLGGAVAVGTGVLGNAGSDGHIDAFLT